MKNTQSALNIFYEHYRKRLEEKGGPVPVIENVKKMEEGKGETYFLSANDQLENDKKKLKEGNGPRIFHHGSPTDDVIVLTHGLSDSPFYMEAIGKRFFDIGCNVILPLLPGHGLVDPNDAMEDRTLDSQWKATMDNAVECAKLLGDRISLGGFSTGGALSLNKILRDEEMITGGLFLFSAALSIGRLTEMIGRMNFLQTIAIISDGEVKGIGQDPYKYPVLPSAAGIELIQIINDNKRLSANRKIPQPTFAAHSVHDHTAKFEGILDFLEDHVKKGIAFVIAEADKVEHGCLPLIKNILLNKNLRPAPAYEPKANPRFDWMMENAIRFFREEVRDISTEN